MVTDQDKLRLCQLDDKSDYSLWLICVTAAISAMKLDDAMSERASGTDTAANETFIDHHQQASNIIVATLSDQAVSIVRTVIGKPNEMMNKLNERYDSKSTASKIAKMSELVSMRYMTLKDDLSGHFDRMAGLLEQLKAMENSLDDSLYIGILVASIEVSHLLPVTAAIKTLVEKDVKLKEVTGRLLEERTILLTDDGRRDRASPAHAGPHGTSNDCAICQNTGHETKNCFLNPLNPNNKLNLPTDMTEKVLNRGDRPNSQNGKQRRKHKKSGGRSAVARACQSRRRS